MASQIVVIWILILKTFNIRVFETFDVLVQPLLC